MTEWTMQNIPNSKMQVSIKVIKKLYRILNQTLSKKHL